MDLYHVRRVTKAPLAPAAALAGRLGVSAAFIKFLFVGGMAFIVNQIGLYALYDSPLAAALPAKDERLGLLLFTHPDARLLIATVLSVEAAIVFKFAWSEGWIFRDRRSEGSIVRRFVHFNVSCAASAALTIAVTNMITVQLGVTPYLATAVGVLAGFLLNWLWAASIVWPVKPQDVAGDQRTERGSI